MCRKPFTKGAESFGCGQCMPCRVNRRRVWTYRLVLESLCHEKACFVTLTYSDECLPDGGSLVPRDLTLFMKRLRKHSYWKIRYFGCGEYGDLTERPHYHLALYGVDRSDSDLLARCWRKGHVHVGDLTVASAAYVCGYVTKKMTGVDDVRLQGRFPEFARMSLRPGIGAVAVGAISDSLDCASGKKWIEREGDVPGVFRFGGRMFPCGRYIRGLLREGRFGSRLEPVEGRLKRGEKLLDVYASLTGDADVKKAYKGKAVKEVMDGQRMLKLENRLLGFKRVKL